MEEMSITMDQIPIFQNHYYKKMSRTIKEQSGSGRTIIRSNYHRSNVDSFLNQEASGESTKSC